MTTLENLITKFYLRRSGREWRGRCPACGYGNGAFVLFVRRDGRPVGWCASCQDRNAISRLISGEPLPPATAAEIAKVAMRKAQLAEGALSLWYGSCGIADTPAARYLDQRGLPELRLLKVCDSGRIRRILSAAEFLR